MLPNVYHSMQSIIKPLGLHDVLACNEISQKNGLVLSAEQAEALIRARDQSIRNHGRVELGIEVVKKIITAFCASSYINRDDYAITIIELIEIFYEMKNETEDRMGDDELIDLMQSYFNNSCRGSLELLRNRELALFARQFRRELQEIDYALQRSNGDEIYKY